jgi:site-specific DNA recombinase
VAHASQSGHGPTCQSAFYGAAAARQNTIIMRSFRKAHRNARPNGCGTCNSPASIKAVELEARVLTGLKDILIGNDHLIDVFVTEFKAELARLRNQRGSRDRQLQKDLNKINTAIKRCLTFITEGDGDPGLVRDELQSLESRKRELECSLKTVHDDREVDIHPNIAELYRKKVGKLQTLLNDEATRSQAIDLIRSMIDHIEINEGIERGKPDVILVGALAQILTFTQQNKTAASNGSDGRVLMVAGARMAFRLRVCASQSGRWL